MTDHNPCSLTFTRPDPEFSGDNTLVMRKPHTSEFHFTAGAPIDLSDVACALRAAYVAGARDAGGNGLAAQKAFDVALFPLCTLVDGEVKS